MDTLRLYDPSTLLDTQALEDIRELCLALESWEDVHRIRWIYMLV